MAEYIEREALISELKTLPEQERIEYMGIYDCIRSMPTADVAEVKHGAWLPYKFSTGFKEITNYTCSECGRKLIGYSNPKDAPYCHCGATMDLGDDEV